MRGTKSSFTRRDILKHGTLASGALITGGAVGTVGAKSGKGKGQAQKCDIVVPEDYDTIQAAVDNATSGDTICIQPGTYSENVSVDVEVTLKGRTPPNSGRPAVIHGWVSLNADGAELHQTVVTRTSPFSTPGFTPDPFGVRVTASDTVVADNVVRGLTDAPDNKWGAINGIQVFSANQVSNVTIRNNEVRDTNKEVVGGVAGIKLQADLTGIEVTGNSVTDLHSSGWVWGVVLTTSDSADGHPKNVLVQDNTMDRLNDGSVYDVFEGDNEGRGGGVPFPGSALGIGGGADAGEATVKYNNLLAPNGAESKDEGNTLVAECNWWGAKSGPTDEDNPDGTGTWALERGDATIDFTPWLNAPAPSKSCVGGKDRGNGRGQ